jgi:hypothetical protein
VNAPRWWNAARLCPIKQRTGRLQIGITPTKYQNIMINLA